MPQLLAPLAVSLMIFVCTFAALVSGIVLRKKLLGRRRAKTHGRLPAALPLSKSSRAARYAARRRPRAGAASALRTSSPRKPDRIIRVAESAPSEAARNFSRLFNEFGRYQNRVSLLALRAMSTPHESRAIAAFFFARTSSSNLVWSSFGEMPKASPCRRPNIVMLYRAQRSARFASSNKVRSSTFGLLRRKGSLRTRSSAKSNPDLSITTRSVAVAVIA